MQIRWDWKFFLTLALGLASLVAPWWLWKMDLVAKAVEVRLVSSAFLLTSLDPKMQLKVTEGGTELRTPALSTIDVVSSGGKPIASADFESPLEIQVGSSTTVRSVVVASREPASIQAAVVITDRGFQIKPLLLNPGDAIRLSVLTDGSAPEFAPQARIAGVKDVPLIKGQSTSKGAVSVAMLGVLSLPAMAIFLFVLIDVPSARDLGVPRSAGVINVYLIALLWIAGVGASINVSRFNEVLGFYLGIGSWLGLGLLAAVSALLYLPLRKLGIRFHNRLHYTR